MLVLNAVRCLPKTLFVLRILFKPDATGQSALHCHGQPACARNGRLLNKLIAEKISDTSAARRSRKINVFLSERIRSATGVKAKLNYSFIVEASGKTNNKASRYLL